AYRYRYGRPGGGIAGMVFLVLLLVFIVTHIWVWLVAGIVIVAAIAVILRLLGGGMPGTWFTGPQQPYQPYQQPQPPEQSYQPYEQGYQPAQGNYQDPPQPYQNSPQSQPPADARYEEPTVKYPQDLPPMDRK